MKYVRASLHPLITMIEDDAAVLGVWKGDRPRL